MLETALLQLVELLPPFDLDVSALSVAGSYLGYLSQYVDLPFAALWARRVFGVEIVFWLTRLVMIGLELIPGM